MAENEVIQKNDNTREKTGSILRHILKVKDELIELPEYAVLTDRIDGGSSCETITLDDEFTPRNIENICEYHRETFSDDSLEDSSGKVNVKNVGGAKHHRSNLVGSLTSTNLNAGAEKSLKKPSMIPKLSRNFKTKSNSNEHKYLCKNSCVDEQKKYQNVKTNVKFPKCQVDVPPMKLTNLQQKLKATTSIIKQKMEYGNPKVNNGSKDVGRGRCVHSNSSYALIGQEKSTNSLAALYGNIVQMRETALALSKSDNFKNQKGYIEKLFKSISDIQNIADKLDEIERKMQYVG
ncbi:uncharacterized protein LOC130902678 isoform X2 [Diorhabda carinulata]|uniref:uncharacterized protein LOC130902678 isoform X2 n=1 Tax=Diorhabda carinulata TaxID=1163345 RepID=UPI0025A068A1|nr:uncharacterized protein LOC130902678 isoform X2 [Diorhabda carinulata]